MKRKPWTATLTFLLLGTALLHAQGLNFPGGKALMHTQTAWVLEKGAVTVHSFATTFSKTVAYPGANGTPTAATFWDVQGAIGVHYAYNAHFEFGFNSVLYQDNHDGHKGYNIPNDITFLVKGGSWGGVQNRFRIGFLAQGRIPTGKPANIPFEPYSSGNLELGVTGLASYSKDLLIPEAGFNAHLNLGFWYHNDVGQNLSGNPNDNMKVTSPTTQMPWALAAVIPTHQFDFGLELFGSIFLNQPPPTAYGRENYTYLTPSVVYRVSNRLSFSGALDLRLSKDVDQSSSPYLHKLPSSLPNYPLWRVRVGTKIHLTRPEPRVIEKPLFTAKDNENSEPIPESQQLTIQEQLVKERRETEIAEEELSKIRENRKRMERMLEHLRQILQEGKSPGAETETENGTQGDKKKN